jgi:hypothetical protein
MCPIVMPDLIFRWPMVPGFEYEISTRNTLPDRSRFMFFSTDNSESVKVRLFMQKAQVIDLFVDGDAVVGSTDAQPMLPDPAGTNMLDPQGTSLFATCWYCCLCMRSKACLLHACHFGWRLRVTFAAAPGLSPRVCWIRSRVYLSCWCGGSCCFLNCCAFTVCSSLQRAGCGSSCAVGMTRLTSLSRP